MSKLQSSLEISLGGRGVVFEPIPPITDPMGKYWDQPHPSEIEVDDTHAMMTKAAFSKLHDYSHSQPTGTYAGKMWKVKQKDGWWLCWFGVDPDPKFVSNNYRKILITDAD